VGVRARRVLERPEGPGRVLWLEPGQHVFRDELEAAELEQGATVGEGDVLLVRTGHTRRLRELGPWPTATAKSGLHPTAMPFLSERSVSALGSDGNGETAPSSTEGVDFPIHVLALNAMGVHPARLPVAQGPTGRMRTGRALGVPLRGCSPADHRRNWVATQPAGGAQIGARLRSSLRWSPPRRAGVLPGSPCGSGST
jgi:kynurenine formamidase